MQMLASLAAVGALAVTALSLYLTTRQTDKQDNIAIQSEITNRYTAAVNQLGSSTMDIRLGGIYALQRIADNSAPDEPTIVAVLSAFIRNHPPGRPNAKSPVDPPPDIAAAVTSLQDLDARDPTQTDIELQSVDFAHISIDTGAGVTGTDLARANFALANLSYAGLDGENLNHAGLFSTNLSYAQLADTNLSHAHLEGTNLSWAGLNGANLTDATLDGANLSDAFLDGANLTGADLSLATFHGTLPGAKLTRANLYQTPLCAGTRPTRC